MIGGPATQLFAVMFGPRGEGQRGQGHHLVEVGVILELDPGATSEVTQGDDGYLGVDRPDLRNENVFIRVSDSRNGLVENKIKSETFPQILLPFSLSAFELLGALIKSPVGSCHFVETECIPSDSGSASTDSRQSLARMQPHNVPRMTWLAREAELLW